MASVQNTYRQYRSVRGSPEISPGDIQHLSRWEKAGMHSHREVSLKSRGHAERTLEAWSFLLRRDVVLCTGRKWLLWGALAGTVLSCYSCCHYVKEGPLGNDWLDFYYLAWEQKAISVFHVIWLKFGPPSLSLMMFCSLGNSIFKHQFKIKNR